MSGPLVIVTGSNGWLGRRLVGLLARRELDPLLGPVERVRGFDLAGPAGAAATSAQGVRVEFQSGDLRAAEDCRRLLRDAGDALVLHTAGIIHPRRIRDLYAVNVAGTRNLLEACRGVARRVVLVSSNSPFGCNASPAEVFGADAPYHPYMNYGRSKMQMELLARELSARGQLPIALVRAPWFYGPDQPPRQTLFFQMIRQGKMPLLGTGENRRSMAYVDNLAQGLARAAVTPAAAGKAYWISDRRPYPMSEIIDTVERLLEAEFGLPVAHRRRRLPTAVGTVAEWADRAIQATGLYNSKVHVLSEMDKTIACSIDAAVADLGYDPQVDLEEGMRRSIRWCLESGAQI